MQYEIIKLETIFGEKFEVVVRSDGAIIPINENNSDYQTYLASLGE